MADAADIGARVLAVLEAGRLVARLNRETRAAELRLLVLAAADRDAQRHGERGRAGRIALRLRGLVTERHVRRLLEDSRTRRVGVSELSWSNGSSPLQGSPDDGLDR